MTILTHYQRLTPYILFFGSLLVFTFGLSHQEVIGFDSRFYLFAQEMWRYGISWFPTTYQQPYPDYPSASTVFIHLFAHVFGGVSKFTAVLPSAMMASITVVMTYYIGLLRSQQWGLCGALFMLLTLAFLKSARAIALDMYPTAITAICFYLVSSADEYSKPYRRNWVYPLLLLGFIFRGPIGLVMPAGVIFSYYSIKGYQARSFRPLMTFSLIAFVLLVMSAVILLTLAHQVGGEAFMQDVLRMQVMGRLDSGTLPRYFYFTNSLGNYALTYPFALLTIVGVLYATFKRTPLKYANLLYLLIAWMLIIMLGMSIPGDRKDRYILPIMPAIALLAAYPFVATAAYFTFLRQLYTWLFLYFPAILLLGVEVVYFIATRDAIPVNIHFIGISIILIAIQLLSLWCCYRYIVRFDVRNIMALFFAMLSFVVTHVMVIEPIELYIDRTRDFVVAIEKQREQQHAKLIFYREHPDGMPIKYLINMPTPTRSLFVDNLAALDELKEQALIITSEAYFAELPKQILKRCHIVANDTIGHVRVVVFTLSRSSQNRP